MPDTTDGVPDRAELRLDLDVAKWLRGIAVEFFGGDVQTALNEMLRVPMAMNASPDDPWAGIEARLAAKQRGLRQQGK
jgi:hypothetical protein